jgi:hypothetical protein
MRWILIFLGLTILSQTAASALPASTAAQDVRVDTASSLEVRGFSAEKLAQYRRSASFQYEGSAQEAFNWWDRLKAWFWEMLAQLIQMGTHTLLGRLILILLAIGVVVYAVFKIAGIDRGGLLESRNRELPLHYVNEDDIHSVDFDRAVGTAVAQGNYRLAVRLWYLKTLKNLADKEFIRWKPGKTNHEYVMELDATPYAAGFVSLTRGFEYSWYGETPVASSAYDNLEKDFLAFNQQLA